MDIALILTIVGTVAGVLAFVFARRDAKKKEQKDLPTISLFAKGCKHQIRRKDAGDILHVQADVAIDHVSGHDTQVTSVTWNGHRGRCLDENYRSDCEILAESRAFFDFYFDVPITGKLESWMKNIESKIAIECTEGCRLTVDCASVYSGTTDTRTTSR